MKYGFSLDTRRSCFTVLSREQSWRRISFSPRISVVENGKLTRYRANVTTDYLSLLSTINDTILGGGLAATLIHARQALIMNLFFPSCDRFHKIRIWSRDKVYACPIPGVICAPCRRRWTLTVAGAIINVDCRVSHGTELNDYQSDWSNCCNEGQGWLVHFPPPSLSLSLSLPSLCLYTI